MIRSNIITNLGLIGEGEKGEKPVKAERRESQNNERKGREIANFNLK